jgi:mRNA-degrading endonuclease toxin of MazEF toxin-antitoxin module
VLIVQCDAFNQHLRNKVVAQITSTLKRSADPAHYFIDVATPEGHNTGLLRSSVVSCYNLNTLNEQRIKRSIGRLDSAQMTEVDNCLRAVFGL